MSLPRGTQDGTSDDRVGASDSEEGSVQLDLLRADLYRLLDELVHAGSEHHQGLVAEFERAWEQFKEATARTA